MSALVNDNFNRADENPLANGNWSIPTGGSALQIVSNAVRSSVAEAVWHQEYWSALTWPNDQYSQVQIIAASDTSHVVGAVARAATGALTYYHADANVGASGPVRLWKRVAGTFTQLGSSATPNVAVNDLLRCDTQSTTIRALLNSSAQVTATDSDISSGSAGATIFATTTLANAVLDNWEGGGFGASWVSPLISSVVKGDR